MSERKQQILQAALQILVTKGYGALSMRAVAAASDLKLGALQYHYRTRADLVSALAASVTDQTAKGLASYRDQHLDEPALLVIVDYMLHDHARSSDDLDIAELFVQLWAMALVEPAIRNTLDGIYAEYLAHIERCLHEMNVEYPRADALVLMATLEGLGLFVGKRAQWADHVGKSVAALRAMLLARYPQLIDATNRG